MVGGSRATKSSIEKEESRGMGVALQAGVLAGGVVFVPMALAGWHLTRNRVLFFSAALFIVLAVSVHLLPYFPSMTTILHSMQSPWHAYFPAMASSSSSGVPPLVTVAPPVNCVQHLHDLVWDSDPRTAQSGNDLNAWPAREFHWARTGTAAAEVCRFQKLKAKDMVDLFRGTWIVVAGDSQLRFFFLSLLDLLRPGANPARAAPPERHANYDYFWGEENIRFEYVWSPFPANLTKLVVDYRFNLSYPDVLITGGGLWHMLYFANATRYGKSLTKLQRAVVSLFPPPSYSDSKQLPGRSSDHTLQVPHMFWLNIPTLVNSMLNTEEKRAKLTPQLCEQYDEELVDRKLIAPGGPITLINLGRISRGCGHWCTADGMHYNNATYEAAVHIMVNALLIATQQSPAA